MTADPPPIDRRTTVTLFTAGFFSLSIVPVSSVAVPLWALTIGVPALLMGVALGSRAALSIPFSIYGGALMDRLGTRRIMAASGIAVAVLAPLYPALPSVEALIALQLVVGFAQGLAWMGAQTQISLLARGDLSIVGRFAFVTTSGNFVGPLMAGAAWDAFGAVGAFAILGLCGAGIAAATLLMPSASETGRGDRVTAGDLVPRLGDYVAAFRLTLVPAVGFVVATSFLMTSVYAMRHSFYTVYLENVGLTGTMIGALFAVGSLSASAFGLTAGPARRLGSPYWLLLGTVTIAVIGLCATPLVAGFGPLLALALMWSVGGGLAFPLTLNVLSRAVGVERQGMSVGVRTTVNRVAGFATPIAMGAIAWVTDLATSFFVVGAGILVCLVVIAIWLARAPTMDGRDESVRVSDSM